MDIEIKIDENYKNPRIVIYTASLTEKVNSIMDKLSENNISLLTGTRDGKVEILSPKDIYNIYASNGKVYAITSKGEYVLRLRLYEVEERLSSMEFVRISNSEIINLKKVKSFDLSITATICAELSNGSTAYVSRRYVSRIKKILGIG